jgi:hypothetical protein
MEYAVYLSASWKFQHADVEEENQISTDTNYIVLSP